MPRVVSTRVMRESDAYTIQNLVPSKELMYRAGEGIFQAAKWKNPVAVLCGSGNNAGDGYVVASFLKDAGYDCTLILLKDKFSEDGRYYFEVAKFKGIPFVFYESGMAFDGYGSILDCLLGTGFSGEVSGLIAEAIESVNASGAYVVSADINSGLNGDTGEGTVFIRSDLTVSIGNYKYGHFLGKAKEAMKDKVNIDIGIQLIGPYEEIEL